MSHANLDQNIRIGIIGAGAAGLSAANALKQKGYKQITILEKLNRSGGKSCSFFVDGRSYELGTVFLAPYYRNTFQILKQFNLKIKKFTKQIKFFNTDGSLNNFNNNKIIKIKILWEVLFKFPLIAFKYRKIYQPGFSEIPSELYQPFSTFCSYHKIENIALFVRVLITAYGYGYFDDIPVAYYLKYLRLSLLLEMLFGKKIWFVKEGWGTIWSKVAENFNVFYNQNIIQITINKKIEVKTEAKIYKFDRLIIACPLDNIVEVLDLDIKAQELLSKIEYYDYYCFAFSVENLPIVNIGVIEKNLFKENKGSLLGWYTRWVDSNILTFYVIGNPEDREENIEKNLMADIEKLGGKIVKKYHVKKWKYFPHVSPEVMKNGFYKKLEAYQGQNNTYITGEIMNFSSIESVVEYSNFLVEKYF